MICLSSAGCPAWFQMQIKFDCLGAFSVSWLPLLTMSSHWKMWLLHWVWDWTSSPTCRVQSTFIFNKRRVSLALWFGWGENKTLKQACRLDDQPAPVAFKNLMTHGSAIRIAYRTSLRSSSLWEPRYPPLRIWFWLLSLVRLLCLIRF